MNKYCLLSLIPTVFCLGDGIDWETDYELSIQDPYRDAFIVADQEDSQGSSEKPTRKQRYEKYVEESGYLAKTEANAEVFAPVYYVKKGIHLSFYGDYLYWKVGLGDLDYAQISENSGNTDLKLRSIHYDYSSGFRLGLQYTFPKIGWDANLVWTKMNASSSSTAMAGNGKTLRPIWTPAALLQAGSITTTQGKLRTWLSQGDLSFGKKFQCAEWMILRPSFGLRYFKIDQVFSVKDYYNHSGFANTQSRMQNDSHHFGVSIGLDNRFKLIYGLGILANAAYSLTAGPNKIIQHGYVYTSSGARTTATRFQSAKHTQLMSTIDIQAGMDWNHVFKGDRIGIGLKLGYEYHAYLNQAIFYTESPDGGSITNYIPQQYNLFAQGLFVEARLDF